MINDSIKEARLKMDDMNYVWICRPESKLKPEFRKLCYNFICVDEDMNGFYMKQTEYYNPENEEIRKYYGGFRAITYMFSFPEIFLNFYPVCISEKIIN